MCKMFLNKDVLSFTERITSPSVDETRTRTCINVFHGCLDKINCCHNPGCTCF